MRIYGIHSGRNNMTRLLARSFCRNSSKNFKQKKVYHNNNTNSNQISDNEYLTMIVIGFIIVVALIIMK